MLPQIKTATQMASVNEENNNVGSLMRGWRWFKSLPCELWSKIVRLGEKAKKIAKDDPRKLIHSFKVGLSLTLVSLFYYYQPLYDNFGVNAMWAVLTAVVVLEFSVGGTIGKGLNRMLATLVAGSLGVGAHHFAGLAPGAGKAILLAIFVFIVAAVMTFLRFIPEIQRRFDFGLVVFILTFCLVSISSFREDQVAVLAKDRLSTIIVGSTITMIICMFVFPVWVGEDLHKLISLNVDKIGKFLEGFGGEYFQVSSEDGQSDQDKSFLVSYKSVLSSGNGEQTMANLARWEPCHGRFRFRHPWKQYLKVGELTRECAYKVEALHVYLNPQIQTPVETKSRIKEPFLKISSETGNALKELGSAIHKMTQPAASIKVHLENAKIAAEELKSVLKMGLWEDADLMEIAPVATVASLLMDVVLCTQRISDAVHELADLAGFKSTTQENSDLFHRGTIQPMRSIDADNHVIAIGD